MTSPETQDAALQTAQILQNEPLDPKLTAVSTLSLLNLRLSRLEFLLTGSSPTSTAKPAVRDSSSINVISTPSSVDVNIPTQLHQLQTRLANLKRLDGLPGTLVRMIDNLRREYPELFPATTTKATSLSSSPLQQEQPSPSPSITTLSQQSTEILTHSTLYTSTSAHLQTLSTLRIPPAEHSANLINAAPRLAKLKERQEKLDAEIDELRARSAAAVEWWVKHGVVGMGELWEDWEERVNVCERRVRREERRQREENGEIG